MDLLEGVDHASSEDAHVVLASRPEGDFVERLLEVTDLDDRLGLRHLKHLPEKNTPTVNHISGFLILDEKSHL
jgi:hypothetical protein